MREFLEIILVESFRGLQIMNSEYFIKESRRVLMCIERFQKAFLELVPPRSRDYDICL